MKNFLYSFTITFFLFFYFLVQNSCVVYCQSSDNQISIKLNIGQSISYAGTKQILVDINSFGSRQFYILEIKAMIEYKKYSIYAGLNSYTPYGRPIKGHFEFSNAPLGGQLGFQYKILTFWSNRIHLFSDLNINYFSYFNSEVFPPRHIRTSERFPNYGNVHYVYTGNIGAGIKVKVWKRLWPSLTVGYGHSFAERENLDFRKLSTYSLSQLYGRLGLAVDLFTIGKK